MKRFQTFALSALLTLGVSIHAYAETDFALKGIGITLSVPEDFTAKNDSADQGVLLGTVDGKRASIIVSKAGGDEGLSDDQRMDAFLAGFAEAFQPFKPLSTYKARLMGQSGKGTAFTCEVNGKALRGVIHMAVIKKVLYAIAAMYAANEASPTDVALKGLVESANLTD